MDKCENNVRNVFRDIKLPLGNDMGHWIGLFWSILTEILQKPKKSAFRGGGEKKTFPHGGGGFLCLFFQSEKFP